MTAGKGKTDSGFCLIGIKLDYVDLGVISGK